MSEPAQISCPSCGQHRTRQFYEVAQVPVQSMLLLDSPREALSAPTGGIALHVCVACGLVFNPQFDPASQEFSARYEASQGFSATFNAFHERLADTLIARYNLRGKRVIEIGCGQGEFLQLLCRRGQNQGLGFDPVFDPTRSPLGPQDNVRVIADYYDSQFSAEQADLICCKMTLEHIASPHKMLSLLHQAQEAQPATPIFMQVPNALPILQRAEFWDVYYEHCCYYTPGALARLFRAGGFAVHHLWTDYQDQYLMIDARRGEDHQIHPLEEPAETILALANGFAGQSSAAIQRWQECLGALAARGQSAALWGSGSKAVSFLNTVPMSSAITCVVDINPYRQGKYMAGTGQPIISPDALTDYRPELVVVMNVIYHDEIRRQLALLGITSDVVNVDSPAIAPLMHQP